MNAPDAPEEIDRITAVNDWRPVRERIRRKNKAKKRRPPRRGKDETREGQCVYYERAGMNGSADNDDHRRGVPALEMAAPGRCLCVALDPLVRDLLWGRLVGWSGGQRAAGLTWHGSILYVLTRFYISQYEHWVTWRGKRERLRQKMRQTRTYDEWKAAAKELDAYLGREAWKADNSFAYYDHATIRKLVQSLRKFRELAQRQEGAEGEEKSRGNGHADRYRMVEDLRDLVEMCVKNNFAGIESPRMYSQTYYGTKNLVQSFIDEGRYLYKQFFSLFTSASWPSTDPYAQLS